MSVRQLIQTVGRAVPAGKKGCVGLIRDLVSDLQANTRGAETNTAKLAEREAKVSEPDLNIQLLAEETGRAGDLQKRLDIKTKKLEIAKKDLEAEESVLKKQSRKNGTLEIEGRAARAAISRKERLINDFDERACTVHTTLVRAQASGYLDRLNSVLDDAQARGEHLCRFHVRVGEDVHLLHVGDVNSNEKRGGQTPPLKCDNTRDDVIVMPALTGYS